MQLRVEQATHAEVALAECLRHARLAPAAAARATALAYGTLRLRGRLDSLLAPRLARPLHQQAPLLRSILRVGAYELLFADHCDPAQTVHALVEGAKHRGHTGWSGLVNAILRALSGDAEQLRVPPARGPREHLIAWESLPPWLAERWLKQFGPELSLAVAQAANSDPPLTLRINPLRTDRDAVLARFHAAEIAAEPGELHPQAVRVRGAGSPERLPGWAEGWFSVQDEGAMTLAPLTDARPGQRVIDLCAAPGGKATHLAELLAGEGRVVAVDLDPQRLVGLPTALARLGLGAVQVQTADARKLDGRLWPAEAVLLDAPCTGTGTLARRPDLRWHLGPQRLAHVVELQRELLASAAQLVKPGGVLVYATCSLEPDENQQQMAWFAQHYPQFVPDATGLAAADGWDTDLAQRLLLPVAGRHDGFFAARRRRAE